MLDEEERASFPYTPLLLRLPLLPFRETAADEKSKLRGEGSGEKAGRMEEFPIPGEATSCFCAMLDYYRPCIQKAVLEEYPDMRKFPFIHL